MTFPLCRSTSVPAKPVGGKLWLAVSPATELMFRGCGGPGGLVVTTPASPPAATAAGGARAADRFSPGCMFLSSLRVAMWYSCPVGRRSFARYDGHLPQSRAPGRTDLCLLLCDWVTPESDRMALVGRDSR